MKCAVIDSCWILPQQRKRLYFVGFRISSQKQNKLKAATTTSSNMCMNMFQYTHKASQIFEWPKFPRLQRGGVDILQTRDEVVHCACVCAESPHACPLSSQTCIQSYDRLVRNLQLTKAQKRRLLKGKRPEVCVSVCVYTYVCVYVYI